MSEVQSPLSNFPRRPGWRFVRLLPKFEAHGELLIEADHHLLFVDAWAATVLRTLIEYRGRDQQTKVIISPPSLEALHELLRDALGALPAHASWAESGEDDEPDIPPPLLSGKLSGRDLADRIVLPAQNILAAETARDIGNLLPDLGVSCGRHHEMQFLSGAFRELVDNALLHGATSPIGATASIVCDHRRQLIELVVSDLGDGVPIASIPDFIDELEHPHTQNLGALPALMESARTRKLSADFWFITKGYVTKGRTSDGCEPVWTWKTTGVLPGFTAGVRLSW